MTAISTEASRLTRYEHLARKGHGTVKTGVAIPKGAMVMMVESTGRITNAAATAAHSDVLGVATETKTGNTGGTVTCEYQFDHTERFAAITALTKAFTTCQAYVADNNTVTITAIGTAGVRVGAGIVEEWEAANVVWIRVGATARKTIP